LEKKRNKRRKKKSLLKDDKRNGKKTAERGQESPDLLRRCWAPLTRMKGRSNESGREKTKSRRGKGNL